MEDEYLFRRFDEMLDLTVFEDGSYFVTEKVRAKRAARAKRALEQWNAMVAREANGDDQ